MTKIIDVHTHNILPEYYQALADNNALDEDSFPIPTPGDWSIEQHIGYMDEANVSWSISYFSSPQPHYGDDDACVELIRTINERMAGYKQKYPGRIGFAAQLPIPVMDKSIDEAIYCLDELGANAVKLGSNLRGVYLGDKRTEPLFEELNKRHAIIMIHPQVPVPISREVWPGGPIPLHEFIADTTRAVLNYIAAGFFTKFPNVRLVVPHNGSYLPNIYSRFRMTVRDLSKTGRMEYIDVEEIMKKLYFDTAGGLHPCLDFLMEIADPSHVLYGSDYPFMRTEHAVELANSAREYLDEKPGLRPYKDMILHGNAAKLFGLELG